MGRSIEQILRNEFRVAAASQYYILTFGELKVGERYIVLPLPGDNKGHGGFRGPYYLSEKIKPSSDNPHDNAIRVKDGTPYNSPDSMPVIKIE